MRVLPSGSSALLVELDDLDAVLGFTAALLDRAVPGVADVVPAARTVLVVADGDLADVRAALERLPWRPGRRGSGERVELPVHYDGADLAAVAGLLGTDADGVVAAHTSREWTVAFCGFAPGFGYCTPDAEPWDVPRLASPRTRVPAGAVGLAGGFTGVYPRESPGGWQLLGRTDVAVFDLSRDPAALLRPGVRVRFVPC
ncbi:sensor histidine kinase inhibitor, KipI family [Geodermatophilus dictyosporus]|uniref:Sensor histidine kinase inhibitor, KipI family n=1 Tax=Geodermatophilus dictyosporus TaxID=1523247 RepID=A0A1I5JC98_9ACTN|nr:allophanate hydrolase subunit 1 [Geodermatophilus dictyosporus]SFO70435.1 sensor histidine kinase inhibitor, KipI family [Geodermatophilus dictyosporus]